jgi:cobalt-zinc-cadmium efflux system membrane fusion protein
MSRTSFTATLVLALATVTVGGCHKSQASEPEPPKAAAGEVWLTPEQVKEAKIETAAVADQNVDDTILTSGRVTFDDSRVSHVFSPVSGRVAKIDAQLGQRVKKGQPLATVESPDIGLASADLGKAQADLVAAEHDFGRQKDLFASHATSQKELEQSEDNFHKAKAELDRAKQKASLFRTGGGTVNTVSQGYTLLSGIDGEVIARNVSPGMEIQGQYGGGGAVELFTIGELDKVWVLADVFEMDLARVKVGSKAIVKAVAYSGRVFEGRVDWVSGMLDPVSRTAKVRCTFENPEKLLKPEMYATIQISVDEKKALAVPRSSVLRLGDSTVVFVQSGQTPDGRVKFERLPVTVDEGEGSPWLPVSHGLEAGTTIVTNGAILLSGML